MSQTERRAVGDMKAGLTGAKPKLSILPRAGLVYEARGIEYGADKYARGNYHGSPPAALGPNAPALRLLGYIDAALRHLTRVSDAVNHALGTGGDVVAACRIVDDDATAGFPPSMLPDLAHAAASIGIGIACAVDDGLLPADPGRPWDALRETSEIPQKADPAAERARVESLGRPMTILERPRVFVSKEDAIVPGEKITVPGPRFVVMAAADVPAGAVAEGATSESQAVCLHRAIESGRGINGYNKDRNGDFWTFGGARDLSWSHAIVDTRPEEGPRR